MTHNIQSIETIIDTLVRKLKSLKFAPPTQYVYNPLAYARSAHLTYWQRYGLSCKQVLLIGMNPGPWGMVQTGVPFGDKTMVTEWLDIRADIGVPDVIHPKRPVQGFECARGEVSGQRLWGWARQRFGTPEHFFKRFFVANYCPLVFMEESGRNRTPDKLPVKEKKHLLSICDEALVQTVRLLKPEMVLGVGKFAADQATRALADTKVRVGRITHPSPANPKANAGWCNLVESELAQMGIDMPTEA